MNSISASIRPAPDSFIRAYAPTGHSCLTVRLRQGYAGIRPKISGPGEPARDFVIDGPEQHGLPGLIQLFGFESPGLTSSLAVGQWGRAAGPQRMSLRR